MTIIPQTQKSAMYYGKEDLRVEETPVPRPTNGQVLIKVAWCGICGSDIHFYEAGPLIAPTMEVAHPLTGSKLPVCMGHEFSGTIVELGEGVKRGLEVGDRVVVEPVISCGTCYGCKSGNPNTCETIGFLGLSGLGGGLSSYISVKESYIHKLPDNISLKVAAMIEPLSVAIHAVQQSGIKQGDSALVLGGGPIGIFTTLVLVARGIKTIILSEISGQRRKMAALAGAHHIFSPKEVDVVTECRKLTGGSGVDFSFDCAGVQATLDTGFKALRAGGTCTNVAIWSFAPTISMTEITLSEKSLRCASCYNNNHAEAIEIVSSGKVNLEPFISATIPLEDVEKKGFLQLIHNTENHVKILVCLGGEE